MQYKIAQLMIKEVCDGMEADKVVKAFADGEEPEGAVEKKPVRGPEKARKFPKKRRVES